MRASRRSSSVDRVLLAALAAEAEAQRRAVDLDVAVAQGGQAERVVGPRVLLVADADQRRLEQAHDRRQHLLARQAAAAPRSRSTRARMRGSAAPKASMRVVLGLVADVAPARVVAVLLAARARRGRSPGCGRRGDGQIQTSVQAGGIAERRGCARACRASRSRPAVGVDVGEARARPAGAGCPGPVVDDVAQAGELGGLRPGRWRLSPVARVAGSTYRGSPQVACRSLPASTRANLGAEVDQHLHHGAAAQRLLHALLQRSRAEWLRLTSGARETAPPRPGGSPPPSPRACRAGCRAW